MIASVVIVRLKDDDEGRMEWAAAVFAWGAVVLMMMMKHFREEIQNASLSDRFFFSS
jgi:siroheme synthase